MKLRLIESPNDNRSYTFNNTYGLQFQSQKDEVIAILDEAAVLRSIYTDKDPYTEIGEGCTAIDIALAKGGSDAVVESYYSVMKSQSMSGVQSNDTISVSYNNFFYFTFIIYILITIPKDFEG